mgnify:CR=1 FL=1
MRVSMVPDHRRNGGDDDDNDDDDVGDNVASELSSLLLCSRNCIRLELLLL